jgi:ketosteroid isomerase-like protein
MSIQTAQRALIRSMSLAVVVSVVVFAQTPRSAVDELLAADRAFSASSSRTDLVNGLTAMFADDVVIPSPPGLFVEGKPAVVAMLRANPDNARSRTEWTPVRGGVSADRQQGFTVGFMTLRRPDDTMLRLKYLAYWVKHAEGWRVAAYKRARAGDAAPPLALMEPALPMQLVPPSTDAAAIARHRDSLDHAERAFSDAAQTIGLGAAFARFGSADAVNLGGASDPGLVVGAENIAGLVAAGQPSSGSTLSWAPDKVIVASSGDLGVTIGTIHPNSPIAGQPASFPFFTIWRRADPSGHWRYIAE